MLKDLIKERLMAAADEILAIFDKTIASYEEELSRTRQEKERHRQQLEAVSKNPIVLHIEDVQLHVGHQDERQSQEESSTTEQEHPQPLHVKEEDKDSQLLHVKTEEEALRITQEGEHLLRQEEANITELPLTGVSVKTEDREDKPPESSQLHHNPSEENRGAEPQHMTTEADGDHRGGSPDNLLAPLSDSDDATSHVNMNMESHVTGAAVSVWKPRFPDPRPPSPAPRGGHQGVPRPAVRQNISSVS
uniref:uncharacterized protein LOC131128117 isoform X2 n=1 Tax=Doryrhamphus excisus TaxID=161450 RepID=UPI0025AE9EC1|nr:uncharacterized protein LOC131128117 isoform X2 [Doryrhamphus excisus]